MPAPALTVLEGGAGDPLREGTCRRVGCAEPVVELGLCEGCLGGYRRMRDRRERELARDAVANYRALTEEADPEAEADWLWALGEHLAAHGVDPATEHSEDLLQRAVLDALGDFADEQAGRGHLRVVA